MKVKEVKYIQGGEVLASPVYTEDKDILIPKGAVLKSEYIELLMSLNIGSIEIEDIYHSYEYPVFLISDEEKDKFVYRIQKILEKHIYTGKDSLSKVKELASDMVSYVNHMDLECVYDIPYRRPNLYEHTLNVTIFSLLIARTLELPEEDCHNIAIGCLLHDLGLRYITIPYINQNFKQESPADIFEYKKHTILAYTVLDGEEEWLPRISQKMILSHHEKMDGSGFPLKQKNQELECRIIQLCDTFDCLITGMECERCSIEEAMHDICSEAGRRYDLDLIYILFSRVAMYPVGTEVEMSNQRCGIVTRQTKYMDRPIIMSFSNLNGDILMKEMYNLEEDLDIQIRNVI